MLNNQTHLQELQSPSQTIKARVELYNGSTLATTCTCDDVLKSFTVEKEGENKFFGFGICQKLSMTIMGQNVPLTITKEHDIEVAFGVQGDYLYPYPSFHTTEVQKDAETDEITLVAYDALYRAAEFTVSDLNISTPYTIRQFAEACAQRLGVNSIKFTFTDSALELEYTEGANFEGSETLRAALNAVAEAIQAIYYIDSNNELVFKRLGTEVASHTIDRNNYISLKNSEPCVLSRVVHATELGDNIAPESSVEGVTQYIRDNPFWELREDITTLVENAQAVIEGISIAPFECEWFGNYLLELGDKIELITRNGAVVTSYFLKDSITYNGSLSETTSWTYDDNESETETNPTSLGDIVNKTTAKVDKVNKQITLRVNEVTEELASTDSELKTIKENQTRLTQTATDITLRVESIETDGVTRVETGAGFTFDDEGLRINKDGSGIENLLDNTGMYVKQDGEEVLSANEKGVKAKDLHAVTYLWIGSHSRFEDYEGGRTGCFWISE